ncbi:MAG TPA: hypothetical protein VGZ48_02345 [Candidatus Acidoferrales bacterium]|nr:hypothetical protein [Candidatus Acidoferrales bacterium]
MRKQIMLVAFALVGLAFGPARSNQSQAPPTSEAPTIVIEASWTNSGIGGYEKSALLVRVFSDKTIQYDKVGTANSLMAGTANTLITVSMSDDQLSSLQQRLRAIDKSEIKERMGPYNQYVDTWQEFQIQLVSKGSAFHFSVTNPWPCPGCTSRKLKPLPEEIRRILCESSKLRSLASHEPIDPNCDSKDSPSKKGK